MALTLRAYNVLFGDCLLLSWDERDGEHHAWVDFGNFHNDPNAVFTTVYEDVLRRTGGALDLVVITHKHMDHLEGFYSLRKRFAEDFTIDRLWHPRVTPSVDSQLSITGEKVAALLPDTALEGDGALARIFRNNFGTRGVTTQKRLDDILVDLPYAKAHAIHRETALDTIMPAGMKRLKVDLLAPEKDSRVYLEPLNEALRARQRLDKHFAAAGNTSHTTVSDPFATGGVPAEESELMRLADFARIRRQLQTGGLDLLGAVDRTRNNTSIVMRLRYGRRRLLFTGDAEEKSWEIMKEKGLPLSSHLVKVGHHGSHNASPEWSYKKVLRRRYSFNAALISTDRTRFTGTNEVPKAEVVEHWEDRLKNKTRLLRTDLVPPGESVAITYS